MRKIAEEAEIVSVESGLQAFEEEAAEQPRERLDGEKEVRAPLDPSGAVGRKSAAGDDAVNVGAAPRRLAPSVRDGEAADPRSEPARIGGQRSHGLESGLEQHRVEGGLVVEGDGRDRRGQREHDVEIGNRQQLGLAVRQPLRPRSSLTLRTMPIAARVVGGARRAAVVAGLDMSKRMRSIRPCRRAPPFDTS